MAKDKEEKKGPFGLGDSKEEKDSSDAKDYDNYSLGDAEDDGWIVVLKADAEVLSAQGTGANIDLQVRPSRWQAEKTYSDHLITAQGTDEESLAAAIASQQASLDSAANIAPPPTLVVNDNAGNDNEGLGSVLPELKVARDEETGEVEVVQP